MAINIKGAIKQVPVCAKHLARWAKANSNWLLSAFAVLGVAVTAEEVVRATIKAVKICEEKQIKDGKEVIKTVWKLYIPAVGFFLLTTFTILGNAKINAVRFAAATSLIAANQNELKAFKDKAKEILGERKVDKIEDEVEREKVKRDPPPSEDMIVKTGHGNDLFKDYLSGRYLRACSEFVEKVDVKLNKAQLEDIDGQVTASYYLEELGLDGACYVGEAIWDLKSMKEKGYSSITLDTTSCGWEEVNGKMEMVSTIMPRPLPTGVA